MPRLQADIEQRLEQMRRENPTGQPPPVVWPEACYGSVKSWLVFVGPSPGDRDQGAPERDRDPQGGGPRWNDDFRGPQEWSPGFRIALPIFLETIMGMRPEEGALRLFAFANFDWIATPDARTVSEERMRRGVKDVLRVLGETQPKVVVSIGKRAHQLLTESLGAREKYEMIPPAQQEVRIDIDDRARRCHRYMDAYRLIGSGPLAGSIVVRSPQHPARIFTAQYAGRCARAIRTCVEQLDAGESVVIVSEPAVPTQN